MLCRVRLSVVYFLLAVLVVPVKSDDKNVTTIIAAILGRKGQVDIKMYEDIATALKRPNDHCQLTFTAVEYDTTDGKSLLNSLENARRQFNETPIAVAIGPQIDVFTSTDYVITKQIHFVTTSDEVIETAARQMTILPDPRSLSRAIGKTVKHFGWNRVAFLSQDDFSPVLALSGEGIFVSPIRLPSGLDTDEHDFPQLQQTLTTLRESQMDKFILHSMNKAVVKNVIAAALKLHLLHHSISWLITYLDFNNITGDIKQMSTLYGFQLLDEEYLPEEVTNLFNSSVSRLQQGMMRDVVGLLRHYAECETQPGRSRNLTAQEFLHDIGNTGNNETEYKPYFGALGKYVWPKDTTTRDEYTVPILRRQQQKHGGRDGRTRITGPREEITVAEVVYHRGDVGINYVSDIAPAPVKGVFKNKVFRVVAKLDEPFVMKTRKGKYRGFCVDVLRKLSRRLDNFDFEIRELEEEEDETPQNTDKDWDRVIRELKEGKADLAIGAFAVTAEREEKISFSYTIMTSAASLMMKRPPDTVNYFQFLGPFSTELWMMIIVFFLTVGLGLYIMGRFDKTQQHSEQKFDFKESMWYSLTVLLQGSADYNPETTCMRTIVVFFWFCTLVINAAYTANLAAFLTLQQIDTRIKSVEHLSSQTAVRYGVRNNSDLMTFFKEKRIDPYERMWAFMKLNEDYALVESRDQAVQKVLSSEGHYIYIDDGVINNYLSMKDCELESIDQNFWVKHFGLGFPRGAPYRGDINQALLELKEQGQLDAIRNRWWNDERNCSEQVSRSSLTQTTASELNISNMFGVFIVLIAFTILAILYEIGSIIFKCYRKQAQEKKEREENDENKALASLPPPPNTATKYGLINDSVGNDVNYQPHAV